MTALIFIFYLIRVLELEKRKEQIESKLKSSKVEEYENIVADSASDSEEEIENETLSFDWRAKKSHK